MPFPKRKMGLGKGGGGAKDMSQVTSWENWCVNFSFFFVTGAQAILWPWCPVILKAAGLRAFGSGLALSLITLSSIIGVRYSLWAVNKTRNGAVRRFLLLGMFSCSIFFSISSVLMLPSADDDYFCSTKSIIHKIDSKSKEGPTLETKKIIHKNSFPKASSYDTAATSFPSAILKGISNQTIFIRKINLTQTNYKVNVPIIETTSLNNNNKDKRIKIPGLNTNNDKDPATKDGFTSSSMSFKHSAVNNRTLVHTIKTYFPSEVNILSTTIPPEARKNIPSVTEGLSNVTYLTQSSRSPNAHISNIPPHKLRYTNIMSPSTVPIIDTTAPNAPQKQYNEPQWPSPYGNPYEETINKIPAVEPSANSFWEGYASPIVKQGINSEIKQRPRLKEEYQTNIVKRELRNKYPPVFDYHQTNGKIKNISAHIAGKKTTPVTSFGVGVAAILIIAMLMGGGVESAISKIMFCRKNGLCQDTERIDDMDITITPVFQICVMGEHRYWSLISSSLWITLPTIFVGLLCQMGADIHNPLTIMGAFHGLAGLMSCFTLLFIPMPYGCLRRCRSRRPLSLYLDDEVIREGLRRVFFHLWVLANGLLGVLPTFFTLWLLQESSATKGEIFVTQAISVTALLFGEAAIYPASGWLSRKLNTQGVMIISSSFLWIQCLLAYYMTSPWVRSGSLLLVGYSVTTMWTAIKNNAFLLGTARDQEQEAWASWISWKMGSAFGAIIWASLLEMEQIRSVQSLLLPSAIIGMIITTALICITLLTMTKEKSRRRIYHTLDLNNYSEDEDDEEITSPDNEKEDDWLVKRAKKEGLTL